MGKIKKLKDVELVGGTEQSDVYPITSTKAIYDENNKRLDSIISELQKSADSSLETENKTIVGSINELKKLLDEGYLFKGVATPDTNPGVVKQKVFYIANGKGTYTNFGGLEVTEDEVVVLYWDSSWHKVSTGIASQAKLTELEKEVIYDVTANNSGATFASLSELLLSENLSTLIPSEVRCGGMSIRFVQSSDNKYVQYRCIAESFSADPEDWKGEEADIKKEPTNDCFYLTDGNGNVLLYIAKNGQLISETFDSNKAANKDYVLAIYNALKALIEQANERIDGKQNSGNYVEFDKGRDDTKLYWKDAEGNVIAIIAGGHIITSKFDSSKSLIQSTNGGISLFITDIFGNVLAAVKDGDVKTKKFDSKAIRILVESTYDRVIELEKDNVLLTRKMIPALSWIDDDFDTSRMSYLTIYRNWCNAHDIHGDIALIPNFTIEDIPNSGHKDITNVYFTPERLALLQEFENEGFEFLVHPPHYGLYKNDWNVVETPEYIRKNFAMTVRCFLDNNICPDILVYPGGSSGVDTVKECARKYFTCAITPSGGAVGNPRIDYSSTRYQLPRLPIVISQDNTVTMIKNQIATALSNNEWVILISHVWMFSGDGTEATDETSMSFANLFDIITYANTLQKIKPVREVWRTRQILWDYYRNY